MYRFYHAPDAKFYIFYHLSSFRHLPLFYIQLWQEQAIQWVELSASIENIACLFLFLSLTDSLSRYIFPQVPFRSFSITVSFFLSLLSMSFVSTVLTVCGLIPAVSKHSSCSQKQLWLTSPGAAQFHPVIIHFSLCLFSILIRWLEI